MLWLGAGAAEGGPGRAGHENDVLGAARGHQEVDGVADEAAVEVHDLGLGEAVLGAVLGLDDAEADLSLNLVIRPCMTLSFTCV